MRSILGILAGFIGWWVAFYASLVIFAAVWPGLLDMGRRALESNDYGQISTPALTLLIVMYFWVNPIAGWLTVLITRNRNDALITAMPLFAYAAFAHYYRLWNNLPDWYNLIVPVLIPPLVYLGGRLAGVKKR